MSQDTAAQSVEAGSRIIKPVGVEDLNKASNEEFNVLTNTDNEYRLVVEDDEGRLCPLLGPLSRSDMRVSVDAMIVAYEFAGKEA